MKKEAILAEIQRTAEVNGGTPLGHDRFLTETGIKVSDWHGKYWVRWGDALIEAGFKPNVFRKEYEEDFLLDKIAALVIKLGHVPVKAEILIEGRADLTFPDPKTLDRRYNSKLGLIKRLMEYCSSKSELIQAAVHCKDYLDKHVAVIPHEDENEINENVEIGFVYLVRAGKYYKIGRSNAAGRREREIALQLPEKSSMVHVMRTDDPVGIEAYWHKRFDDKRKNGEWFELTADDVRAFKRRKFM